MITNQTSSIAIEDFQNLAFSVSTNINSRAKQEAEYLLVDLLYEFGKSDERLILLVWESVLDGFFWSLSMNLDLGRRIRDLSNLKQNLPQYLSKHKRLGFEFNRPQGDNIDRNCLEFIDGLLREARKLGFRIIFVASDAAVESIAENFDRTIDVK